MILLYTKHFTLNNGQIMNFYIKITLFFNEFVYIVLNIYIIAHFYHESPIELNLNKLCFYYNVY
jgi:hypothetical protein